MIKVAAFTSGKNTPSARFRIRQHISPLRNLGIDVQDYCPVIQQNARLPGVFGKIRPRYFPPLAIGQIGLNAALRVPGMFASRKADLVWIERSFVMGLEGLSTFCGAPRVLDVDDAIWLEGAVGKSSAMALARRVDLVIAGNNYLAEWFKKYCSEIVVIPTAVDTEVYQPKSYLHETRDGFVIGWTGTSPNFAYLDEIAPTLGGFLRDHRNATLLVVADRPYRHDSIPDEQIRYIRWQPENEATALREMDVGIMPLQDSPWARGKCSFKMLQYMASALPVVVSPVGMNQDILNQSDVGLRADSNKEWRDALEFLYGNRGEARNYGENGRGLVEAVYSREVVSEKISQTFHALLERSNA